MFHNIFICGFIFWFRAKLIIREEILPEIQILQSILQRKNSEDEISEGADDAKKDTFENVAQKKEKEKQEKGTISADVKIA